MSNFSQFMFTFILTMILPLISSADEFSSTSCPQDSELAALKQDFSFASSSPLVTRTNWSSCQKGSPATVVLGAISYLKKIAQIPHLQNKEIDQSILGDDAWRFVTKRIHTIYFTQNGEGACGDTTQGFSTVLSTAAYVSTKDSSTMHICNFVKNFDAITMASTLVHEARHHDGYSHVDCSRGSLKGAEGACDPSYTTQGSYAAGAEFEARLSQSQNVDPIVRNAMRLQAVADLWERFNEVPFKFNVGILLYENNGEILYYDGKNIFDTGKSVSKGVLAVRGTGNIIYDISTNKIESFEWNHWVMGKGSLAKDFNNHAFAGDYTELRDVLYGSDYSCFLFDQLLKCTDSTKEVNAYFNIHLSKIKATGFIYQQISTLVRGKTPYLVGEDGYLYRMPTIARELQAQGESGLIKTSQPYNYKKIISLDGMPGEYVLNRQGQLLYTKNGSRELKNIPGLEDKAFLSIAPIAPWIDLLE